ncbi:MAG: S-layer homology domain-containing protein [Oscillospiraceae bacterium]|nr:S-layer homology domain-containing protein [Oscillospiraceae bacterium]
MKKISIFIGLTFSIFIIANAAALPADAVVSTSCAGAAGAVASAGSVASAGLEIYVAPDGDDVGGSGEIGSPLQTLDGARQRVRSIKEESGLPDGGITVYFRGGHYYMEDTVWFLEDDSGTAAAPITYTAYPGESPVFTGGLYFGGADFAPASGGGSGGGSGGLDPVAARIPAAARGSVYMINLLDNGFTKEELAYSYNLTTDMRSPTRVVYVDDAPLHMARYPNKAPGIYPENPYHDYIFIEDGGGWAGGSHTGLTGAPTFYVPQPIADRVASWDNYDDALVSGMICGQWLHDYLILKHFDPIQRTIELEGEFPPDPHRPPQTGSYYFQNVPEELDAPGEFYIDPQSGTLLFYPPASADISSMVLKVPKMNADMLVAYNASWLTFSNLTFELGKRNGLNPQGSSHFTADGLTIKNMSGTGIYAGVYTYQGKYLAAHYGEHGGFQPDEPSALENGLHYTIKNCDIVNMGCDGVIIHSGRVSTRESGHFLFENNVILNTGYMNGMGGVHANGVGISLLSNTLKFSQGIGMIHDGPDGLVAFNEIIDVMCDPGTSDSAGLGVHHGGLAWGTRVHDNIIRDIQRTPIREWGWGHETVPTRMAIYIDGPGPGSEITRNVVYNAPAGLWVMDPHLYPEVIANNIFIDVQVPVMASALHELWRLEDYTAEDFLVVDDPGGGWAVGHYFMSGVYKTLWRDIYPEFFDFFEYLLNDKESFAQSMAPVYDNICVNMDVPLHIIADPAGAGDFLRPMPPDGAVAPDPRYGGIYGNNRYISYNPGFADYAGGNIQLTEAAAAGLGIEWIDLGAIGARRAAPPTPTPTPTPSPSPSPTPTLSLMPSPSLSPTPSPTPTPSPSPSLSPTPIPSPPQTPPQTPSPTPTPTPTSTLTSTPTPTPTPPNGGDGSDVSGGSDSGTGDGSSGNGAPGSSSGAPASIAPPTPANGPDKTDIDEQGVPGGDAIISNTPDTANTPNAATGASSSSPSLQHPPGVSARFTIGQRSGFMPIMAFNPDHIAYQYGYLGGDIQPDASITRAEASAMLFRILADQGRSARPDNSFEFSESEWYYDAVTHLASIGIITGYADGTFRAGNNITRAEFIAMICRFGLTAGTIRYELNDIAGHWAEDHIGVGASNGLVSGYPDGTFRPDSAITRAEAVCVINRLLYRAIDIGDIPDWAPAFPDLNDAHWAYADIMEASTSHKYERKENGYEIWTEKLD